MERNMTKLMKAEVSKRLEAALAALGEEDCDEKRYDNRIKWARIMLQRAIQEPVAIADEIANDRS
jgi:hypothetical protein